MKMERKFEGFKHCTKVTEPSLFFSNHKLVKFEYSLRTIIALSESVAINCIQIANENCPT